MIISQTPMRISFMGGGTDFPSFFRKEYGTWLSAAIDKYVYVIVKKRFDDDIVLNHSGRERVRYIDEIKHDLIREAMRVVGVENGVEITTLADIPTRGCGLGSSSSVTVGLLNALYAYVGKYADQRTLFEDDNTVELTLLRKSMGVQDQAIAAYGGIRKFHIDRTFCLRFNDTKIDPNWVSNVFSLWYLNSTRSAENVLEEQNEKNKKGDNLSCLHALKKMVPKMEAAMFDKDVQEVGILLDGSWNLKRELASGISNAFINEVYENMRDWGAYGGKVVGAGGGGFMMVVVPPEYQEHFRKRANEEGFRELPFNVVQDGSKILLNTRR